MDVNLPKFLAGDLTLFHGIIADLFPEIPLPQSKHSALLAAIQQVRQFLLYCPCCSRDFCSKFFLYRLAMREICC